VPTPVAPTTGFQWRAREVAVRTPTNGALAAAYRGRFAEVNPVMSPVAHSARTPATLATTPMRTRDPAAAAATPRRSLDMTPGRTEQARRAGTALSDEPQRAPVGRRAVDRPGSNASPQRVNPGNRDAALVEVAARPSNMPERVPQARPANPEPAARDGNDVQVIRGDDRSGYEGVRVIPAGAPEARRADDDRPASRPNVERGQMQAPGGRMDRGDDPSPIRAQPRDDSPAPRAEPRGQARSGPSGRGGDGWSGGGRGGWGGGPPATRGGGGGGGGGPRGGAGAMSAPSRHR
jgi:translation initiation factor IF-2